MPTSAAPASSVLGRILLLQSTLQAAPDEERLMQMLAQGLVELPGVSRCVVCVTGLARAAGSGRSHPLPTCSVGDKPVSVGCPGECPIEKTGSFVRLALRTNSFQYGALFIECEDREALLPYEPFLANTSNLVALHLENARHAIELDNLNRTLEEQIQERTGMLRDSEALLRTAGRTMRFGGWSVCLADQKIVWSDEVAVIHGREPGYSPSLEEAIDFYAPEWRERIAEVFYACAREGTPYDEEMEIITVSGNRLWVRTTGEAVRDESGTIVRAQGAFQDITVRKGTEEALRESEERHRTILRTAMDGFWQVDLQGRLVEVNEAYCRMSGYSEQELLTMSIADVEAAESPNEVVTHVQKVIAWGEERFETRHRRKDGIIFPVEISAQYKSPETGRIVVFLRDLTDRKQAEKEREELQDQLSQAQKMESVGRLAGGVAHDFNNMLGIILGHVELAANRLDPTHEVFADLTEIRKAAERSADLTRQLLAFARKQTVSPRVLDLNETVEGILRMLRRLIGEDIDLVWMPGRLTGPVKVDPSQIDQLLANLCVNARDAIAGVGKITIETEAATFDEVYCARNPGFIPGEYVMLAVSDNGCGMDQEMLPLIFEPFFTTKEVGRGTGLGLATVYGIVKQNNGFIDVYSEPGRGTTFKIYLPRHKTKADQLRKEDATTAAESGHETILLVEDELAILRMTTTMLEHFGYTVLAASRPGQAIHLAKSHVGEIHLLMTDVVMPEMNGRDLAKNLLSLYPGMKRLFMSGYTANVIAHHGVLDQGVHFIQKPFSLKVLAAKVREVLDA